MVQGANKKSDKKKKKEAPKKKHATNEQHKHGEEEVNKTITKKVKQHQKNIYKSIEEIIIGNAKKSRERFDIL
jgi:hypothetical protein